MKKEEKEFIDYIEGFCKLTEEDYQEILEKINALNGAIVECNLKSAECE